ncbi:hypothetical protein AGMMS50262_05890 [Bacteroidia bacterium]|nr:hypothetical protein AGMMS50262_05890 [Bacteroidia bacterium]
MDNHLAYGVITGKYFWFYAAMGLIAFVGLLTVVIAPLRELGAFRFSISDGLIIVFCFSGLAVGYYHNETITTKFILLLLLLVLYFYFRIFLSQNKRYLPVLLLFLVITGLVEAVWGLRQLYGFSYSQHNLFKTTGSFFNPGPYAGYLAVVFPLALNLLVHGKRYRVHDGWYLVEKWIATVTCIAILLVLPATMSRASWLASVAGSIIVILSKYRHRVPFTLHRVSIIIAGTAVIIVALLGMYHLKKDSADGRALMWKVSLQAIPKHPFGVGLGNFPGIYASEQALYFASGQASEQEKLVAGSPEYGFNEYLQICIEWGIIPFLLFLAILIKTIYTAYKRKQWSMLASLVSLLVFAGMSYPFSVLPFAIVLVFLLAAMTPNPLKGAFKPHPTKSPLGDLGVILLGCLLTVLCLYNRYPTYKAYKKWNLSQILYQAKAYEPAKKDYVALYPYLNDNINFLFEYGRLLSNIGQYHESNQILQQASRISGDPMIYNVLGRNYQSLKEYRQAENCFLHATQILPNRLYPWYLLCKLYAEMGLPEKVNETAAIVQTKEPKVQSVAVREMREEVKKIKNNMKNGCE